MVAYTNNTNAGQATITITGAGNYTGTKTVNFTINQASPVTTWPTATAINFGQALSDSNLSGGQAAAGSFAWQSPDDKPSVGTASHGVTFTPTDMANYISNQVGTVSVTVNAIPITSVNIGVIIPVKDQTPSSTVSGIDTANFTAGSITWSPTVSGTFAASTAYTATVTLTAKTGYTFTGLDNTNVKVGGNVATSVTNNGNTLTLTYTFPATDAAAAPTVTGIAIKSQPTKLIYTHGDTLDLAGLVVTLTYSYGSPEDVAFGAFGDHALTADPANGIALNYTTHNGKPVTIARSGITSITTSNLTVAKKSVSSSEFSSIANVTYSGNAHTPSVTVTLDGTTLSSTDDYTTEWSNNLNAGTATVEITGKGNYENTASTTFVIEAKDIDNSDGGGSVDFVFDPPYSANPIYTGSAFEPTVKGTFSSNMVNPSDFTVVYTSTTNAGQATVTITGHGNFTGTTTLHFEIDKATPTVTTWPTAPEITIGDPLPTLVTSGAYSSVTGSYEWADGATAPTTIGSHDINVVFKPNNNYNTVNGTVNVIVKAKTFDAVTVDAIGDQPYTGSAIVPEPVVKDNETPLTKGSDYTVSYSNNTNAGTATVTITGINHYAGASTTKDFTIVAKNASGLIIEDITGQTYNHGTAIHPTSVVVKDGSTTVDSSTYDLSYGDNTTTGTGVGSVTVTFKANQNYTGTKTKTFDIGQQDISGFTVDPATIDNQTHTGSDIEPMITSVSDGSTTLIEDTDYEVTYENNVDVGTDAKVIITGKGNYTGNIELTFEIEEDT